MWSACGVLLLQPQSRPHVQITAESRSEEAVFRICSQMLFIINRVWKCWSHRFLRMSRSKKQSFSIKNVHSRQHVLNRCSKSVCSPHLPILQPMLPFFRILSPPSLFFLKWTAPLYQLCPKGAWTPIGDPFGWGGGGRRSRKDGGGSNGFAAGEDYHLL